MGESQHFRLYVDPGRDGAGRVRGSPIAPKRGVVLLPSSVVAAVLVGRQARAEGGDGVLISSRAREPAGGPAAPEPPLAARSGPARTRLITTPYVTYALIGMWVAIWLIEQAVVRNESFNGFTYQASAV